MKDRYSFDSGKHVHMLNGKRLHGTTEVLKVLSKPLTWWASGMACQTFGWMNPKKIGESERGIAASRMLKKIRGMNVDQYQTLLAQAYAAHDTFKEGRATTGKDMHADAEAYIRARIKGEKIRKVPSTISRFVEWAERKVKKFLFTEVHCYSREMWVGGICDFAYQDLKGNYGLADLKSSDAAYFDHMGQIGAYDMQLHENGAFSQKGTFLGDLKIDFDFHAVFPMKNFKAPWISWQVERNKRIFQAALILHKDRKNFDDEF